MNGMDNATEQRTLALMMYDKTACMDVLSSVKDTDFAFPANRALFRILATMAEDGQDVNPQSVYVRHGEQIKTLELGRPFAALAADCMSVKAAPDLIAKMRENTALRTLLALSAKIREMAESGKDSAAIYDALETAVINRTSGEAGRVYITPQEMAIAGVEVMFARMDAATRKRDMIFTSLKTLNYATGGFDKGDLIILSAPTGTGKSALAMNIARDVGITQGRAALYLNSEMSTAQMALRWDACLAGVSHSALRTGRVTPEDVEKVQAAQERLHASKMHTANIPDMQVSNVLAEIRRMRMRHGIEFAVVDYIGRMDTLRQKDVKEWQVMLNAARNLKTIAQEQGIVVLMAAQLTRGGDSLAQGSYMQHEADLWINLERVAEEKAASMRPWNMYLEIRKARNAEVGKKLPLAFDGDKLRFTDSRETADKWAAETLPKTGIEQFGKVENVGR